jgi:anti-sigma regulatory factor (Ser/Thr protein kinase)
VQEIEKTMVKISLPGTLVMLRPLHSLLREFLECFCPLSSMKSKDRFILAVHEAFANICQHSYGESVDESKKPVDLEIVLTGKNIELNLRDRGTPFDQAKWKAPDLEEPAESGRGVWLIKQAVDQFFYESRPDGVNVMKLAKFLE